MTGDVHRQTQKSTRNAGFHSDNYASDTGRMVEKQSLEDWSAGFGPGPFGDADTKRLPGQPTR
jgi:hypothetical protein